MQIQVSDNSNNSQTLLATNRLSGRDDFWIGDLSTQENTYHISPHRGHWVEPIPSIPYIPNPWDRIYPYQPFATTIAVGISSALNRWRVKEDKKGISLSLDLPGVKIDDLNVDVEDGKLTVTSKRFDTKVSQVEHYNLGTLYDPNSVKGTLESGVLTIKARKFPNFNARKVTVDEK